MREAFKKLLDLLSEKTRLDKILFILQAVAVWWLEKKAKENPDDVFIQEQIKKRIERYDALENRDSGKLSRDSALFRDRLRLLLSDLRMQSGNKSSSGEPNILSGRSEMSDGTGKINN